MDSSQIAVEGRSRKYLDFVLLIEDAAKNADTGQRQIALQVLDSPAGESMSPQVVETANWDDMVTLSHKLAERNITKEEFATLSSSLGNWLLPDSGQSQSPSEHKGHSVRELFFRCLKSLTSENEGVRLRLRIAPSLAWLPWEYASVSVAYGDGSKLERNLYLGLDPAISIVRHESVPEPKPDYHFLKTRHVICATACPPRQVSIDLKGEQRAIRESLHVIQTEVLARRFVPDFEKTDGAAKEYGASAKDIQDALLDREAAPDIFHFIGHGEWDPKIKKAGLIECADRAVDGKELAQWLRPDKQPTVRLVILQSCNTAASEPISDGTVRAPNLAAELLRAGVPSVIAMQHEVSASCAREFVATLLSYMGAGLTIDEAMALSRIKVKGYQEENYPGVFPRDWGTPVLYLRNSGGNLFPVDNEMISRLHLSDAPESDRTLGGIMKRWLRAAEVLADTDQVDAFRKLDDDYDISPLHLLLLLQSAVKNRQDTRYWVCRLGRRGRAFLEEIQRRELTPDQTTQDEAARLLGLDKVNDLPPKTDNLSWVAAHSSASLLNRQTAALARLALNKDNADQELDRSIRASPNQQNARRVRIELFGTLANARDSGFRYVAPMAHGSSFEDRLSSFFLNAEIWGWRVKGHLLHSGPQYVIEALRGATGAGLAIASYRAALTLINQNGWGAEFATHSYLGFIAGFMLVLGMKLAFPLLLVNADVRVDSESSPKRSDLLWLQIPAGAVGFCAANVLIVIFTTRRYMLESIPQYLSTSLAFGFALAGLGLYQNVSVQAGKTPSTRGTPRWLSAAVRVGSLFGLLGAMQAPVLWEKTDTDISSMLFGASGHWQVSPLVLSSTTIQDRFQVTYWMKSLINECSPTQSLGLSCFDACQADATDGCHKFVSTCFEQFLSILDAAIAGILLVLGIRAGSVWIPKIGGAARRRRL